jgi:hypothetical protein
MGLLLRSVLFIAISSLSNNQNCQLLPNGTYRIKYTFNPAQPSSIIKIVDDTYYEYLENGDSARGKIKWIYDCNFMLNCDSPINREEPDTSYVGKILRSQGQPCFKLQNMGGDTIFFDLNYLTSIEITLNKGEIIRLH